MVERITSDTLRQIGRQTVRDAKGRGSSTDVAAGLGLSEGIGPAEQYEIDLRELNQSEFARKYGKAAADARARAPYEAGLDPVRVGSDRRRPRTPEELANDLTVQTAGGLAQGIAGLTNIGLLAAEAGINNPQNRTALALIGADPTILSTRDARQAVAEVGEAASETFSSFEGDIIKDKAALAERQTRARYQDSQTEFENSEKSLVDNLKKIGRDAIIKGAEFDENPALQGKTAANAVGSLAPSIFAAGGTTAVVRGILGKYGLQATKAGKIIENVSAAGAVGAVEGQGAYNQVVTEVNGTSFEDLEKNSPAYQELIAEGVSPREARAIVAEAAGLKAQQNQTLIASGVGLVFRPGFEANPFDDLFSKGVGQQLWTLAGETIEEGIQSGSGEFSANLGIRENADENRDLSEGVGAAITEGAVGGFFATSVIQTPGAVKDALVGTASGTAKGAKAVAKHRAEVERRKADDQSPVGEKATTENISTFEQILRDAERAQELIALVESGEANLSEEQANDLLELGSRFQNVPTDLTDTTSDDFVARTEKFKDDVVEGSRTQTLRRVGKKLLDEAYPDTESTQAAAEFVQKEMEALQAMSEENITNDAASESETVTGELAATIIQNKTFSQAFDKATEVLSTAQAPTPRAAVMNPVGVDSSGLTDEIVDQAAEEVKPALRVVREIKSPETAQGGTVAVPDRQTNKTTRKELLFNNKRKKYGIVPSFNDMVSMMLRAGINQTRQGEAVTADPDGNKVDGQDVFNRLKNLIQHQQNKFEAAVQSYEFSKQNPGKNSEQTFDQLSEADGETFLEGKGKIYVNAGSNGSIETFRRIAEDVNTGIRAYNALIKEFPDLYQGEPIPEVTLPEDVPARPNAETSQTPADQQTQATPDGQASTDPSVDTDSRQSSDSLRPNQLSFKDLFKGGTQTTFAEAVAYLETLGSLTPGQAILLRVIKGSAVFKGQPGMVVRQATAEELEAHKTKDRETKGWFDPVAREIVVGEETNSLLLHEMIHAITVEILNQTLTRVINKRRKNQKLTPVEQAAQDLRLMATQFMQDQNISDERVREVQAMMEELITDNDVGNTNYSGSVMAIAEFMAYGLTEAAVQRDLAKREYVRPNLAARILSALRRLFGFRPDTNMFEDLLFNTHRIATDYQAVISAQEQTQSAKASDVEKGQEATVDTAPEEVPQETPPQAEERAPEDSSEPEPVAEPAASAAEVPGTSDVATGTALEEQGIAAAETVEESTDEAVEEDTGSPIIEDIFGSRVQTQDTIKRSDLKSNPDTLYLFGDNDQRRGKGGQAKAMRGEDNAVGVRTKAKPSRGNDAYWTDDTFQENRDKINEDLAPVLEHIRKGGKVVIPSAGLGTGLSELASKAPRTLAYLNKALNRLVELGTEAAVTPAPAPETTSEPVAAAAEPEATPTQPTADAVETVAATPDTTQTAPEPEAAPAPATEEDTLQVGLNLATNGNGENLTLKAHFLDPVMRYADTILGKLQTERENLDYNVDNERVGLIQSYVDELETWLQDMQDRFQQQIAERNYSKKEGTYKSVLERVAAGEQILNEKGEPVDVYQNQTGLIFNLMDKQSLLDGEPVLDEHLLRLGLMAAMDYFFNTENGGGLTKAEDIIKALGLPKDTPKIEGWMYDVVNFGRSGKDVKEGIAAHIRAFWGAQIDNSVSPDLTKGISEALADEILDYLTTNEDPTGYWVLRQEIQQGKGKGRRTYVSYKLGTQGGDLAAAKTILRDVFTKKESRIHQYKFGEPFSSAPQFLQKNPDVPVPEEKRKATQKQMDTPFFLSNTMLDLFVKLGALGDSGRIPPLAQILGYQDTSASFMNELHKKSVEGKNSSIQQGIRNVAQQLDKLQEYADKNGLSMDQVPIHYLWEITLNGRFQMQGFNPQGDKLAREIFTPTRSTIDLTKAGDVTILYAAIGQALDQFKIEKIGLEASAVKAQEFLAKPEYQAAMAALRDLDNPKSISTLTDFFARDDVESSARLLKALMVANQVEAAIKNGDQTIDIDLAMELDGKTNGPITAAIQMNTEQFSETFLATVRRGGFFIGNRFDTQNSPMNYATYNKIYGEAAVDLYEITGQAMSQALIDLADGIKNGFRLNEKNPERNKKVLLQTQRAVVRLIKEFGDIKLEQTENGPVLTIKRKGTKSPITKNLYGAGTKSISAGLANDIMKAVYEEITKAVQTKDGESLKRYAREISLLEGVIVGGKVFEGQYEKRFGFEAFGDKRIAPDKTLAGALQGKLNDLQSFEFDSETASRIMTAIDMLYMPAFVDALDATVGGSVKANNDVLVKITNAQTNLYIAMVRHALDQETLKQRAEGKIQRHQQISEKDYRRILNENRRYAPVYDSGFSIFDLAGGGQETSGEVARRIQAARQEDGPEEATFNQRTRALSGKGSESSRRGFEEAGVKALPYNVIANSDAAMISGVYTDERILLDTLAVHDGIEVPVGRLREMSEIMNEKVADSWQFNTVRPILESIDRFLELELDSPADNPYINLEDVAEIQDNYFSLQDMVDRRQARINALNTVEYTVDGAPGAERPYVKEGARFNSEAEMLTHLKDEFNRQLAKIREERAADQAKGPLERTEREPDGGSELRKALSGVKDINKFVKILGEHLKTEGQRQTYAELIRSKALKEAINAGLKFKVHQQRDSKDDGHYDPSSRTIDLYDVTGETALHELLHATTYHQLEAHYENPFSDRDRGGAVLRLESMMADFLARRYPENSIEREVQGQILKQQELGNKPAAMAEFMSWSLTNEELIARGKRSLVADGMNQLRSLGKKIIAEMRRILGFASPKVFDNVLFNTSIVLQTEGINSKMDGVLRHEVHNGTSDSTPESQRKLRIQKKIADQVTAFLTARNRGDTLETTASKQARAAADYAQVELDSMEALSRVEAAGFNVQGAQDHVLFRTLQSIFAVDFKTDKIARLEAQRLYEALMDKIGVEQMLTALGSNVGEAGPALIDKAQAMVNVLRGQAFTDIDGNVRKPELNANQLSNTLGTFLALAQVSPEVRSILENINLQDLGLDKDLDTSTLESLMASVTDRVIGRINSKGLDVNADQSAVSALDALTEALLNYEAEAAMETETRVSGLLGKANAKTKEFIESRASTVSDRLEATARENGGIIGAGAAVMSNLADLLVEDRAKAQAETLTNALNNPSVPEAIRNLWAEIVGMTADTAGVLRFVKAAKQTISVVRQEYIEKVPQIIMKQFSDDFTQRGENETNKQRAERVRKAMEDMFNGFGKADIAALMETLGDNTALSMFGTDPTALEARNQHLQETRQRLKEELSKLNLSDAQVNSITTAMYNKAQQLGKFQITGESGVNLLRNAEAITLLLNEDGLSISEGDKKAFDKALSKLRADTNRDAPGAQASLNNIIRFNDALASIHALDALPAAAHNNIRSLMNTEREGIKYALSYLKSIRKLEMDKHPMYFSLASLNGYKGHMANKARRKYSVIVADKFEAPVLREHGYVEVRDYNPTDATINTRQKGKAYFFSAHQKLPTYNQGAMQTVQDTYFGIDPRTGLTVGPETTGNMVAGDPAKLINRRLKADPSLQTNDNLIPVFSGEGTLIGYERALAPDMLARLEPSKDFAEALGTWSGRIVEENMAAGFNRALIDAMKKQYDEDPNKDAYADFGRELDPETGIWVVTEDLKNDAVWKESYFLIPEDARRYAERVFGGPIKVRRDQVNNTLGFRSMSVGDVWSARGRMTDETRETMRDIFRATPFIGQDIYKYLTVAEEGVQQVVSEVKHIIVVKSGVVLAANTLSNVIQLAGREVPLGYMAKRTKSKFAELQQYKRNEEEKIKLRADAAATDSVRKRNALLKRIELIEESEQRMSIAPLLNANQFTTISEGLTDADKAAMDGRLMDWIEGKAAELPGPLSTVARYAIISKDTALYEAMSRAVQYSDFIAKAVYYDFLTEEKGLTADEALLKIDQEFINYDLNDSRVRTYLESIGMTWFMNFKLRSLKIAIDLARNNPVSVLLSLGAAGTFGLDVGSPVADNIAGATADGRIGYSLGPGMIQAGWNLNFWNVIFGR